jgi:hypothetical protein
MADKKEMSDEKAARLAAIRAANAAKKPGGGEEAPSPEATEQPASSMSEDKAARLAAIRAANADKKAGGEATEGAPTQKISEQPAESEGKGKSMSEDKAARLAAIRAANADKKAGGRDTPPAVQPTPTPASEKTAKTVRSASPTPPAAKPTPAQASTDTANPSSRPITMVGLMTRIIVGAIIGTVVLLLFGTTTIHYQSMELAAAFGAFFGAVSAYIAGLWPPSPGDETTE